MIKCKVAGLVVEIEKNGFQILVQRKILHKYGYFVAIFGEKAMFGPTPNDKTIVEGHISMNRIQKFEKHYL